MYITIIGFILTLFYISCNGFEKRRSFDDARDRIVSSKPLVPLKAQVGPTSKSVAQNIVFDFYKHWQTKHTKCVTVDGSEQHVVERDRPVLMRIDHLYGTLHEAAVANDENGIERLLKLEPDRESLDRYDQYGQTALQCAVDYSCDYAIACLIKHGARADLFNCAGEYNAWILAELYAGSGIWMNVVPLMALQQALAVGGKFDKYPHQRKKKRFKEKKIVQERPSKIIRLKRRARQPEPVPAHEPEDGQDDLYLLNV